MGGVVGDSGDGADRGQLTVGPHLRVGGLRFDGHPRGVRGGCVGGSQNGREAVGRVGLPPGWVRGPREVGFTGPGRRGGGLRGAAGCEVRPRQDGCDRCLRRRRGG